MSKNKRMDNPRRVIEYQIEDIINKMNLKGDEMIGDVGCGTGIFSVLISKYLHNGKVVGIDISNDGLDYLRDKVKNSNITNIDIVLADENYTHIEKNFFDIIFTCVVLHEIEDKESFLNAYRNSLKQNGKIFIVEFMSYMRNFQGPHDPSKSYIKINDMEKIVSESGFSNIKTQKINDLVYLTIADK